MWTRPIYLAKASFSRTGSSSRKTGKAHALEAPGAYELDRGRVPGEGFLGNGKIMNYFLDLCVTQNYTVTGMKRRKKKSKAKMGRPRKPRGEKWSETIMVRMKPVERRFLEAEAKKAGISLSSLLMRPWRERMK